MPRYRSNIRFGPWRAGDIFESTDPHHAVLVGTQVLTELPSYEEPEPVDPATAALEAMLQAQADGSSDTTSDEEPALTEE